MYQLMINRKNSKKGFTLVEVIVVLVILAILAAIMIPAMTGWIDRATEKSAIVEARTVLLAIQTLKSEEAGGLGTYTDDAALALAAVGGTISTEPTFFDPSGGDQEFTVKTFGYTTANSVAVAYDAEAADPWSVD